MEITNLRNHQSSIAGGVSYYTADLVENGHDAIKVKFSAPDAQGHYVAYNEESDSIYPVESVSEDGNEKVNISTWHDGDVIVLGPCVR